MRLIKKFQNSGKAPTKEEYIQKQADQRRRDAHRNMLNVEGDQGLRIVPVLTEKGYVGMTFDQYEKMMEPYQAIKDSLEDDLYTKQNNILAELGATQKQFPLKPSGAAIFQRLIKQGKPLSEFASEYADQMERNKQERDKAIDNADTKFAQLNTEYERKKREAGIPSKGLACITNVLYPYGIRDVFSNQDFQNRAAELGFTQIPVSDVLPGDIYSSFIHGVMIDDIDKNGKILVNESHGAGPLDFHYNAFASPVKKLRELEQTGDNTYTAYRFVGTPQDSAQWSQEWEQLYNN